MNTTLDMNIHCTCINIKSIEVYIDIKNQIIYTAQIISIYVEVRRVSTNTHTMDRPFSYENFRLCYVSVCVCVCWDVLAQNAKCMNKINSIEHRTTIIIKIYVSTRLCGDGNENVQGFRGKLNVTECEMLILIHNLLNLESLECLSHLQYLLVHILWCFCLLLLRVENAMTESGNSRKKIREKETND